MHTIVSLRLSRSDVFRRMNGVVQLLKQQPVSQRGKRRFDCFSKSAGDFVVTVTWCVFWRPAVTPYRLERPNVIFVIGTH